MKNMIKVINSILTLSVLSILTATAQPKTFRYLALGDSYTIGESVAEAERWPNQLMTKLRADKVFSANYKKLESPEFIARTGWTSGELSDAIQAAKPKAPYTLVTLLIGVNNQYRGYSADGFRRELKSLIRKAIIYAGNQRNHVIVVSIPDWGVTPYGNRSNTGGKISKEIDFFNRINKEEAALAGVTFVDITGISRKAHNDASYVAPDGLHPSGKMYGEWADLLLPIIKKNLQ